MTSLVHATNLAKSYVDGPRVVRVLHELDLTIEAGECVAVVGASGIGKSTLLHVLGTLDIPDAGRFMFDGTDVFAQSEADLAEFRNREIGFVFQFHQLLPDFTAVENVMFPALLGRASFAAARRRAVELLERVGLKERLDHRPGELSGGEQQRVAVARGLMQRPRLLLADEPTGNLDPETGAEVHRLLLELNREQGAALVVVTHNEKLANAMGRTLHLINGRLHEDGRATAAHWSGLGGSIG
jgi:lipoprotein-releasing system ATP-binding protein